MASKFSDVDKELQLGDPGLERGAEVAVQGANKRLPILRLCGRFDELSLWWTGPSYQGGTSAVPFTIEWALYLGAGCIIDDEPTAVGLMTVSSTDFSRSGLLWQVRGRLCDLAEIRTQVLQATLTGAVRGRIAALGACHGSTRPTVLKGSALD